MAAVPIYVWNGSAWQETGPTIPANPIKYQASAPSSPSTGDIWVDSDADVTTGSQQFQRFRFVASGGETTISGADANGAVLAYTAGLEQVVLNGAVLVRGHDYTATTGTTITGLSPALVASDVLEVFSFIAFTVANTYTQSQVDGFVTSLGGTATAWTSYTPVLKQGSTTVSATVTYAKYKQIGKTVFLTVKLVSTGTGSAGGRIAVSAPTGLVPTLDSLESVHGNFGLLDAGTAYYHGFAYYTSTAGFGGIAQGSGDAIGANSPSITMAVNDTVMIHVTYEVA